MRAVGMGNQRGERDDYEWVRLADLPAPRPRPVRTATPTQVEADDEGDLGPLADALVHWVESKRFWHDGAGDRVLLVDLDNLRAGALRWRARMGLVVALARTADHVVISGQHAAVQRGLPHLAEFGSAAVPVADGADLADHVLLDGASAIDAERRQVVVMSNDGIFADLADRGPVTVLSPGASALSDRLFDAARVVIDLMTLEQQLARQA